MVGGGEGPPVGFGDGVLLGVVDGGLFVMGGGLTGGVPVPHFTCKLRR